MPISFGIFLIAVLVGGGFLFVNNKTKDASLLSVSANPNINIEDNKENKTETKPSPLVSPTTFNNSSHSPTATAKNSDSQNELVYPNSKNLSGGGRSFVIESSDDTTTITDWYKEKIRSLGFGTKTFVTTKTNGKVLNKLVGASGEKEIKIEISKEADQSGVRISVDIS